MNQVDGIADYVVEVISGELGTDELKLHLLVEETRQVETEGRLRDAFKSKLKVVPSMSFVGLAEIEKMQLVGKSRKVKKFIDSRT
jgi:phenylacetate-CoA ligase